MMASKHIEWIDLAKGICILLVAYTHCKSDYCIRLGVGQWGLIDNIGFLFRMPLYYFLSGLFFKDYELSLLLKKKTNKLLIPFVAFLIVSYLCQMLYSHLTEQQWTGVFYPFTTIWFLFSLFLTNVYFYVINKCIKLSWFKIAVCLLLGVTGFYLGESSLNEYTHLSTSLTALPYFALGYWCNRETNILHANANKSELTCTIACYALLAIMCFFFKGNIDYRINYYTVPLIILYMGGVIGTTGILLISHYIIKLPLVSYLGKYSIIVLITHYFYLQILPWHIRFELASYLGQYTHYIVFLVLIAIELPTIWFCKRYLPYIFAQKDLIK